jgi:hypothetical protein
MTKRGLQGKTATEIESLETTILALQLRKKTRASYSAIGKALGVSTSTAYKKVKQALHMFQYSAVEEYRKIELGRMEAIVAILWPEVAAGKLGSIKMFLEVSKHRAELAGAYAPKQLQMARMEIPLEKLSMTQLQRLADGEDLYSVLMDSPLFNKQMEIIDAQPNELALAGESNTGDGEEERSGGNS